MGSVRAYQHVVSSSGRMADGHGPAQVRVAVAHLGPHEVPHPGAVLPISTGQPSAQRSHGVDGPA